MQNNTKFYEGLRYKKICRVAITGVHYFIFLKKTSPILYIFVKYSDWKYKYSLPPWSRDYENIEI